MAKAPSYVVVERPEEDFWSLHSCDEKCKVFPKGLGRPPKPWCQRFSGKIVYVSSGCWIWKNVMFKADNERNRLNFSTNIFHMPEFDRVIDACRWIYWQTKEEIPDGLEIDHLCEDWRCVNPGHLDPCTNLENNRRYAKTRSEWTIRDEFGRYAGRKEVMPHD